MQEKNKPDFWTFYFTKIWIQIKLCCFLGIGRYIELEYITFEMVHLTKMEGRQF